MGKRTSVVLSLEEAVSSISDGAVIGIGGFITTNKPMALIRALARARKKNLNLVAGPASLDVEFLIALGAVEQLKSPYVGAEAIAPILPFHSKKAGKDFKIEEIDVGTLVLMLKADIFNLPFIPVRGPVGTSLPDLNSSFRWVEDPFGGPKLVAAPPIHLDLTLLHAAQADKYGNVQHLGAVYFDPILAQASDKVIVQVERLVSNEEIRKSPSETTIPCEFVDGIVVAPYGAHPCASQNYYSRDAEFIKKYAEAGKSFFKGDAHLFENYLENYILGPSDHFEYLERVGVKRILSLGLEEGV